MTTASTAARAPASTPARGAGDGGEGPPPRRRPPSPSPPRMPPASRAGRRRTVDAAQLRRRWAERMTGRPPFPRPLRAEPPAFSPVPGAVGARVRDVVRNWRLSPIRPRAVARGCGAAAPRLPERRRVGAVPAGPSPGAWAGGSGGLLPGARRAAPPRPGRRRRPPSVLPRRALALRAARVPLPRGRPARAGARRRAGGAVGPGDALELVRVGQLLHGGVRGRPPRGAGGRGAAGGRPPPSRPRLNAERPAPCGLERVPPSVELLGGAEARLAAPRATAVHPSAPARFDGGESRPPLVFQRSVEPAVRPSRRTMGTRAAPAMSSPLARP